MKHLIFLLIILVFLSSCFESGKDVQKNEEEKQTWVLTTLVWQRNYGNCIKLDNDTNSRKCSRRPLGVCNVNQLIVTQSEVNFTINETRNIQNRIPDCQESILQSGLLSLKASTNANIDTFKSRYAFTVTESCEVSGGQTNTGVRLATFVEIQWLESVRGKIAKAAKLISSNGILPQSSRDKANSCLQLEFLEWEKNLAQENNENKVLLEITLP